MIKNNTFYIILSFLLQFSFITHADDITVKKGFTFDSDDISLPQNNQWKNILTQSSDAVVQIFAMVAQFDWKEPYRTPAQGQGRGSGFFINDEGYILTNAHVVEQNIALFIGLPLLGKRHLKAHIMGVSPDYDIALLKLTDESLEQVRQFYGSVPYLKLGDSDTVYKSDKVLALGYPLGIEYLKSTVGVISSALGCQIQMDAATSPGNSGGPLLNKNGFVIGINTASYIQGQNGNLVIPINIVKTILPDLHTNELLKKSVLGIIYTPGSDELAAYLGNPLPGGCFISDVISDSYCAKAGLRAGDMIYAVDDHTIDVYGEMYTQHGLEKIRWTDYILQRAFGSKISLTVYRNGEPITVTIPIEKGNNAAVDQKYPWHDEIDYEVFAGMVIMELTKNHIILFKNISNLGRYLTPLYSKGSRLVITNIFPDSALAQGRTIYPGDTINEINGESVTTLADLRKALLKSADLGRIIIKTTDEGTLLTDNILTVLPLTECCEETMKLARVYRYPLSSTVQQLIEENKK